MSKLTTQQELILLRSAIAGLVGRDREGSYKPELVQEVFASLERKPTQTFTSAEAFLAELN